MSSSHENSLAEGQPFKVLLMGLPETGKSTFLGALWHVVETKQVEGSLQLDGLEGEWDYVESLRRRWSSVEGMERTRNVSRQQQRKIVMRLRDPITGQIIALHVPDHAGEVYDAQWKDRRWTKDYAEFVNGVSGILLFLHAHGKHKPEFITDYLETIAGLEDVLDEPEETLETAEAVAGETDSSLASEEQYDPEKAPSQVKLVDLLQMHAEYAELKEPIPVAVIVSAWDVIKEANRLTGVDLTPTEYVRREAPLLDQYLISNPSSFRYWAFGVSAQGGDLERDRERLLAELNESDRVHVVADGFQIGEHDITAPLRWVVGSLK